MAKLAEEQPLEAMDEATRAKAKSLREEQDLPKGVRFQPKTLKNGSVVRFGSYGKGKEAVSLGRLGTPQRHGRETLAWERPARPGRRHAGQPDLPLQDLGGF